MATVREAESHMIAEEETKGIWAEIEDAVMIAVIQSRTTKDELNLIVKQAMGQINRAAEEICGG